MSSNPLADLMNLVDAHEARRVRTLNLVASENLLSPAARKALASDMGHRYCIPPEGKRPPAIWDYPNQTYVREVQRIAEELACAVFGAQIADVRALSGNNAASILLTCGVSRAATVASIPGSAGGHFATEEICSELGVRRIDLPFDNAAGEIDVDASAALARAERVDLVFLDASTQLFPHPVRRLRAALPNVQIVYDASHTMGLIAAKRFQDPLAEGADALQGSTHKSLFGPQKGLMVFREDGPLARRIHHGITPLFVSNSHPHHIAALGVALAEAKEFGADYADQVIANARALGAALDRAGFRVIFGDRGFTASHQLVCAIGERAEAMQRFARLEDAGLHVNVIRLPYGRVGYGFRLGAAELTRRGMKEAEMVEIAKLMWDACESGLASERIAARVSALSSRYRDVLFCAPSAPSSLRIARAALAGERP